MASPNSEDEDELLSRNFTEKLSSASRKPKKDIPATIFRVPENIRRTNLESFEPKMVSLGPYHRENQRFKATNERIKLPYATNFFRRLTTGGMDVNLVPLMVKIIKHKESDLRCAYSEEIRMNSNDFVEMMMLDFAFMVEFLWEQAGGNRTQMGEYSWKWAAPSIINDMLVVENQFPLPPLLFLFYAYTADLHRHDTFSTEFTKFLCHPFMLKIHHDLSPTSTSFTLTSSARSFENSSHLLHLFHSSLVSVLREKAITRLDVVDLSSFPSAEMLHAMRIQFANKTDGSSFLDITFDSSKRSMQIPQLVINDDNVSLLRNLIAFEQQCHWIYNYISTYVWFMDCLINTGKDVAVLRKHKIIVSRLYSDEEVAHIFNELRRTNAPVVDFDQFYLAEVINNVERYRKNKSTRLWALWNFSWLRQNYFKNRLYMLFAVTPSSESMYTVKNNDARPLILINKGLTYK
ncbi:UPF0481 protein At3g47200-like isoform X1 [Zingiber officinale]|uniref:UPF0481 protein At3g47200-like isoform X1 n=1 Tax=Zingiber officinale TaxID=94328 RepID=UPI001C4D9B0D|nr:UPF0481 protein At3g47200-like isoform X1 [Zingiber officinale]XP_042465417.1 UPF0481 protein At3g47200-like isoform X1 [Zingiber officinale]